MKILWVKAGKILPVDTGGKIRSYNILRQLAERDGNEIVLLSYYTGAKDEEYEQLIAKQLPGAVAINTGLGDAGLARAGFDYARRATWRAPYAVGKFTESIVADKVREWLDAGRFDVAVCDFLSASLNFPKKLNTPSVLFQHNVESILWQRQAKHEPHPLKRAVFKFEAAKMLAYEAATVKRFHHVIAVSEADREAMSRMTDKSKITVVATGVDVKKYQPPTGDDVAPRDAAATVNVLSTGGSSLIRETASSVQPLVLFLGSMDWEANIDGVEYFCREMWDAIRAQVPDAKFRVVGRNPHPRIKRLASDSIEITGGVASVVEHLHAAKAFVVPLRIGGGTRLKIYEAMAARRAVISTAIGAEGLDVEHNRNILLADSPKDFASAVIEVLQNKKRRQQLEEAAAALAARYDWSVIADDFQRVLQHTINEVKGLPQFASGEPESSSSSSAAAPTPPSSLTTTTATTTTTTAVRT